MARSFSNVKIVSALVVDGLSSAISRRGYAAASQGIVSSVGRGSSGARMVKKAVEEEKVSWIPDPVTGYYRPDRVKEIDVAELRAVLLKNKE